MRSGAVAAKSTLGSSGNKAGDDGAKCIAVALELWPDLTYLNLMSTQAVRWQQERGLTHTRPVWLLRQSHWRRWGGTACEELAILHTARVYRAQR